MECPYCHSPKLDVMNSRKNKREQFVWRRRRCQDCGLSFTTHERFFLDDMVVVRMRNKKIIPYRTSSLRLSVAEACSHLRQNEAADKTEWLVRTIETDFMQHIQPHKEKLLISELTLHGAALDVLKAYDKVSAIKYAAQENMTYEA